MLRIQRPGQYPARGSHRPLYIQLLERKRIVAHLPGPALRLSVGGSPITVVNRLNSVQPVGEFVKDAVETAQRFFVPPLRGLTLFLELVQTMCLMFEKADLQFEQVRQSLIKSL